MNELELYKFDELVKLVSKLQSDLDAISVISIIAFIGVIVILFGLLAIYMFDYRKDNN